MRVALVLAVCTLIAFGCKESSPTAPPSAADLNGIWVGELSAFPTGEDWTQVRLSLHTVGTTPTGTLTSRNGVVHPVTGHNESIGTYLEVGQLPQNAPCSVSLIVKRVTSDAMVGSLTGRCPNTLLSNFRLEKSAT